jgi:uncharacterized membrane protein SirB2
MCVCECCDLCLLQQICICMSCFRFTPIQSVDVCWCTRIIYILYVEVGVINAGIDKKQEQKWALFFLSITLRPGLRDIAETKVYILNNFHK